MENNNWNNNFDNRHIVIDESRSVALMNKVYIWMSLGLGITGITAYLSFANDWVVALDNYIIQLVIAELAMVFILSSMIHKISLSIGTLLFVAYSILNGLTLSPIFYVYNENSIVTTFFITAGLFTALAVYGTVTKRDLTKIGSMLTIGLIGIVIASLVNLFIGSGVFSLIISILGVIIFVGLTAYDAQKIKAMSEALDPYDEQSQKIALLGSLTLYLDFINLFLFLLRIFGGRRN